MICKCGSSNASKSWCFDGKHPRKSPKVKHVTCTKCDRPNRSHGLCEMHYKRAERAGLLPSIILAAQTVPVKAAAAEADDFWAFVQAELKRTAA